MPHALGRSRPLAIRDQRHVGGDESPLFAVGWRLRGAKPARVSRRRIDRAPGAVDSGRMPTRTGVIRPRLIFGVATLLGFYSAFLAYYYVSTFGPGDKQSFGVLLALNLNYWYSWAIVVPGVLWLSRVQPLERGRLWSSIPAHLAGVGIATFIHVTLVTIGRAGIQEFHAIPGGTWQMTFQRMFFLNFDWEMMTYWSIVGLSHALRYHYEAQDRALAASRLETRLVEAQLQTLQRQIQPHFLFNTLNTVSALMHRDVEAADAMLARLGSLLRQSIETVDVQEVALADELDFLEKYVAIEQARFQDRLTVSFEIEPGIEDCPVPNFLLQPLVENSIRHGIGPRTGPGRVWVRAARVGDTLRLEVQDDGVGVDAARLSDLEHGVGLSNTRSRLVHLYGDRQRFVVARPPEGGLSVTVEIPLEEPAREVSDAGLLAEGAA
jgi:two-component system LytT family sensor kinase